MSEMTLRLAYSPDADDAFMFRAAIEGLIDTEGLRFEPVTEDTQSLNDLARSGSVDVTAISVAAWPLVCDDYLILPHGGSIGRGYGPVLVSRDPLTLADLSGRPVASPGPETTAHCVVSLMIPGARLQRVPISPYEAIFEAVDSGIVDAGIIIHEGRLTYERRGLHMVADLGAWWLEETGLPLPLGANVIRRDLPAEIRSRAVRVLGESIRWALEHRDEMITFLIDHVNRPDEVATPELLDRYLGMYANEETLSYPDDARRGMQVLLDRGFEAGVIPRKVIAEFAS